jgi:hypothetical protein
MARICVFCIQRHRTLVATEEQNDRLNEQRLWGLITSTMPTAFVISVPILAAILLLLKPADVTNNRKDAVGDHCFGVTGDIERIIGLQLIGFGLAGSSRRGRRVC